MGATSSAEAAKATPADNKTPLLAGARGSGAWQAQLFSCLDFPGINLMANCLPCLRFAQTAVRAKLKPRLGHAFWFLVYFVGFALFFSPFIWPWCSAAWPLQMGSSQYGVQIMLPWCGVWYLAFPTIIGIGAYKRYEIRQKYAIQSSCGAVDDVAGVAEDCCLHTWCEPCALAQEAVEVDLQELGVAVASASMGERD
jgi:Cys-rich protein (TIGR01571 family)